ncbi:MAG TPA: BTAD domain-containing putative transcriptional regulator, partial [Gemmatimonadaceae bacterium]|nr:BTAD domain-containing putative transcriptional regulator [Gemmatimonadaceae bacterium]
MIELHLIGSVALSRTDAGMRRPLSLAPKPLALLSYLTLGSPRGLHRRDFLLALLWPDLDAQRARNALSQTISRIRAVLGSSAIESRGTEEIRVDPDAVWCDAQAFDAFCRRGAWKDALDLYTGDLLAGFHLAGAPGFEIWRDMESARLRRLGCEAARKLAEQEAGDTVAAALWLRRALAIVPTDERALRQLLQLLDEAGEPASALAAYEEQRQRLLREFEFEPDPETQAFADRIRRRVSHRAFGPGTSGSIGQPSRGQGGITSLAVLPFHNLSGDTDEDYFANGMTDALINALGQLRSVRVISRQSSMAYRGTAHTLSRIAAELQVDGVVEGSVLRAGNRVRI